MDKFEYKVRADEIKRLIGEEEYSQAAEIADTIDWRRVKSVMMLCMVSDLYKINRRYDDAKNMLLLAYERRPGGRTICYSLCELCIKTEDFLQAVNYYKEFVQAAPKDPGRFVLQYKIYEAQEVSVEERIGVLEELKKRDYREKWAYELAYLYHRIGLGTRCVEECDELILWFGSGRYVIKAMELKMLHQPLSPEQQEIYDRRFEPYEDPSMENTEAETGDETREYEDQNGGAYGAEVYEAQSYETQAYEDAGIQEDGGYYEDASDIERGDGFYTAGEASFYGQEEDEQEHFTQEEQEYASGDDYARFAQAGQSGEEEYGRGNASFAYEEELDIQVKTMDVGRFNTINLQEELAAGLQEVLGGEAESADFAAESLPEETESAEVCGEEDQAAQREEPSEEDDVEVFFGETGEMGSMWAEVLPDPGSAGRGLQRSGETGAARTEGAGVRETGAARTEGAGVRETGAARTEGAEARETGAARTKGAEVRETGAARTKGAGVRETGAARTEAVEVRETGAARTEGAGVRETGAAQTAGQEKEYNQVVGKPEETSVPDITGEIVMKQMREEHVGEVKSPEAQPPRELAGVLSQETDGQLRLVMPEKAAVEKQITGQMKIEDILSEWERMKKQNQEKCREEVRQRVLRQTGPMFTEFEAAVRDGLLEQLEAGRKKDEDRLEAEVEERIAEGEAEVEENGEYEGQEFSEEYGEAYQTQEPSAEYESQGAFREQSEVYDSQEEIPEEYGAAYQNQESAEEYREVYQSQGPYAEYESQGAFREQSEVYDSQEEIPEEYEEAYEGQEFSEEYGEAYRSQEPAEENGEAYESQEFSEEYGEAYRSQEPAEENGEAYEGQEFSEEYGEAYRSQEPAEENGEAYEGQEFSEEYGEAYRSQEPAEENGEAYEGQEFSEDYRKTYLSQVTQETLGEYDNHNTFEDGTEVEKAAAGDFDMEDFLDPDGETSERETGAAGEDIVPDETWESGKNGEESADFGEGREPAEEEAFRSEENRELPEEKKAGNRKARRAQKAERAGKKGESAKTESPAEQEAQEGVREPERPPIERDQAKIRALTREEKELFAPFIQSRRSKEQLVKAIDNISMAAYTGNIVVTGEEGMDTMSLAQNMIREVQMTDSNFSGKVAKISGKGLNERDVRKTLEEMNGGALIIYGASGMSGDTVKMLYRSLQQERLGIIVALEDTKKAIQKLFLGTPELTGAFTAKVDMEALSNDTLVMFGKRYAREREHSIDDLGVLALHTRIEELQTIDHVVTVIDVKKIVDEAIRHAGRKTLGHFFDILFAKRYDDEDMVILTEKDFVA